MNIITSESVTEGHPDKIADQISDAILDAILSQDKEARVACETMITNGLCIVAGEIQTKTYVPISEIARQTIREIGYTNSEYGFDYRSAGIMSVIGEQSHNISEAINGQKGLGAGDGGTMYGYACNESDTLMPLPISLAHKLTARLASKRKSGSLPFLRPDGKAQVSVVYDENQQPVAIDNIIVSAQHNPETAQLKLKEAIIEEVIKPLLPENIDTSKANFHINPTGIFVLMNIQIYFSNCIIGKKK